MSKTEYKLVWEPEEDFSTDDFPDLVWHSAYSRGGTRAVILGNEIEGARAYRIADYTDPDDGKHVSRLGLASYEHGGYISEDGDITDDEDSGEEMFESTDIATATFDNLDAAKAEAQRWEAMRIEKSWRGDKWELVDE